MLYKLTKQRRQMLANINPPLPYLYAGGTSLFMAHDDFTEVTERINIKLFTSRNDIDIRLIVVGDKEYKGTVLDINFDGMPTPFLSIDLVAPSVNKSTLFAEITCAGKLYKNELDLDFIDPDDQSLASVCSLDSNPGDVAFIGGQVPPQQIDTKTFYIYDYNNSNKLKDNCQIRAMVDQGAFFRKDDGTTSESLIFTTGEAYADFDASVILPDYGLYTFSLKLEGNTPAALTKYDVCEATFAFLKPARDKKYTDNKTIQYSPENAENIITGLRKRH